MKKRYFVISGLVALTIISLANSVSKNNQLSENNILYDERVEPTCTKTGLTRGSHNNLTNEVIVPQYEIPALGHTLVKDPAVEPTCTKSGLTEGVHCLECGEILVKQEVVPPHEHVPVSGIEEQPTCEHVGHSGGSYCEVCGEILEAQEIYEALGHTVDIIPGKAPTCTEPGFTASAFCSVCEEVLVESEVIEPTGHTPIVIEAVEATCTQRGLTAGSKCAICGEILVSQEIVETKNHNLSNFIFDDYNHWKECKDCHQIFDLEPHKIPVSEETSDNLYSYLKYKERKCSDCDYSKTLVDLDLSSFPHNFLYTGEVIKPEIPLPDFFELTYDESAQIGAHELRISFKDTSKYSWFDLTNKPITFYYVVNPIKSQTSLTFKMLPSEEEDYKTNQTVNLSYFYNYDFSMFEKYNIESFYAVKNKIELPLTGILDKNFAVDDDIYPIYKSSAPTSQEIEITATEDIVNFDINAYGDNDEIGIIYEVNPAAYHYLDTERGMSTTVDNGDNIIGIYKGNTHLSFSIPRYDSSLRDRVYDKYYITTSEDIIKGPVWVTEMPSEYTPGDENGYGGWEQRNAKGCFGLRDPSCECDYANVNMVLNGVIYPNELYDWETGVETPNPNPRTSFGYSYVYNGTTYYFNTQLVDQFDEQVEYYADVEHAKVCIILLCYTSLLTKCYDGNPSVPDYLLFPGVYDYYQKTGGKSAMAAFNTSNPKGADYFAATVEFLAERYSCGEHGYAINYTVGNEVDCPGRWNSVIDFIEKGTSSLTIEDYTEECYRNMRIASQAVVKKSNDAWVLLPFTRAWTNPSGGEGLPSFVPKDMFNIICEKSNKQGNFKWGMNAHPYSDTTGADSLRNDRNSRADISDVASIRQGNLEVMDLIMNQDFALYKGQMRPVYILEGGISTKSKTYWEQQAGSLAYYLLKAKLLKSITALIYYRAYDSTGETGKYGLFTTEREEKLSYNVFKDFDVLSISDWNDKYSSYLMSMWMDDFGESNFSKKDNYLTALVKFGKIVKTKVDFKMRFLEVYGPCRLYMDTYGEDETYLEYIKTHN